VTALAPVIVLKWRLGPGDISAPPSSISSGSEEQCASTSGDVDGSVLLYKSEFDHRGEYQQVGTLGRYAISSSPAPRGCEGPLGSGAGEEEIS